MTRRPRVTAAPGGWRDLPAGAARARRRRESPSGVRWELGLRSGWVARSERPPEPWPGLAAAGGALVLERLPFAAARDGAVRHGRADRRRRRWPPSARGPATRRAAASAASGAGAPTSAIPSTGTSTRSDGRRWDPDAHWSEILADTGRVGDVKLTWEVGRFPHAYDLARAAALGAMPPADARPSALAGQVAGFLRHNPYGRGVHWASGQEIVIRLAAWALRGLGAARGAAAARRPCPAVARHLYEGAVHLERLPRLRAEGRLPTTTWSRRPSASTWPARCSPRRRAPGAGPTSGIELLTEQADRQFYADGGYLMHSHNYQRAALQTYLLAVGAAPAGGRGGPRRLALRHGALARLPPGPPEPGRRAAPQLRQQRRRPPGHPLDLRPLRLPSAPAGALAGGARRAALRAPARGTRRPPGCSGRRPSTPRCAPPRRASVSFARVGLPRAAGPRPRRPSRASAAGRSAIASRRSTCSTSTSTGAARTCSWTPAPTSTTAPPSGIATSPAARATTPSPLDGHDQMVHHRRFKLLYLTRARLLRFEDRGACGVVEGEHDGFRRRPGGCIHRRSVLHVKDDALGGGRPRRGGRVATPPASTGWPAPCAHRVRRRRPGGSRSHTPAGDFTVTTLGGDARPLARRRRLRRRAPHRAAGAPATTARRWPRRPWRSSRSARRRWSSCRSSRRGGLASGCDGERWRSRPVSPGSPSGSWTGGSRRSRSRRRVAEPADGPRGLHRVGPLPSPG